MSLYQIVDEADNLVGLKPRDKIDFQHDYFRVSAVWITNPRGQVLIAQRKLTKDKDPGKWGPGAAGTLEEGETYESNAYKEADEEIGLSDVPFRLGPKILFKEPRQCHAQWYTATTDRAADEFTLQPTEVEKVAWIDEADLVRDVVAHPDKYVASMPWAIEAFIKTKGN